MFLPQTAEMLKIKGLAEMPEQNIAGSIHMSKSLSVSSDKAELLTPSESAWGPDSRCSSAPLSPSMRRKRLRKSSTGSGSGSTGVVLYRMCYISGILYLFCSVTLKMNYLSVFRNFVSRNYIKDLTSVPWSSWFAWNF